MCEEKQSIMITHFKSASAKDCRLECQKISFQTLTDDIDLVNFEQHEETPAPIATDSRWIEWKNSGPVKSSKVKMKSGTRTRTKWITEDSESD